MKTHIRFASLFLLIATFVALGQGAAMAGNITVYNNGAPDFKDAWTINNGFYVDDSFVLVNTSNLTHVDFAAALFPGDTLTSVQWTIYSAKCAVAGQRPVVFAGTATTTDEGSCGSSCEEEGFSLPSLSLPAGTYYLRLQNAVVPSGDPGYWWESGGPSIAYDSALVGTIPSESFDVVDPPGDAPPANDSGTAPNLLGLSGAGALGVGTILRHLAGL